VLTNSHDRHYDSQDSAAFCGCVYLGGFCLTTLLAKGRILGPTWPIKKKNNSMNSENMENLDNQTERKARSIISLDDLKKNKSNEGQRG